MCASGSPPRFVSRGSNTSAPGPPCQESPRTELDTAPPDAGAGSGASGEVATGAFGSPSSYTVAAGDTMSDIAERFGISVDDLFHLNPALVPAPQDPSAYAGEVLNLDVSER